MNELITVVIPNYNGKSFLNNCLDAVFTQVEGTPDFEVLVVDNGSTDGSLELLHAYENPKLRLVELPENTGFCGAVNTGIKNSDAPYVILLNNDTKVKSEFIKSLYDTISADEKIFSVSAQMLMWDREDLIDDAGDEYCLLGWAYSRGKGKPAVQYEERKRIFSACGGAVIYSRKILNEIGIFDEAHFAYLEDLDIGYRANIHGYKNFYEPAAKVVHFGSASTGSRYNKTKAVLATSNNVYVPFKNMPLLQYLCNLPFLILGLLIKFAFYAIKGMGAAYLKGVGLGLKKCFSKAGFKARVKYDIRNSKYYFAIQMSLIGNLVKFLKKS